MGGTLINLFKDVVIYGAGDIVLKSIYFVTLPIYTRYLNTEEYGIWSFINTAIGLMNCVLILGGDSAYSKYYFEAKTFEEKQILTSTWFGFLTLWSTGIVLICLPFTELLSLFSFKHEKYSSLFLLSLITAPITIINNMCGQALRNNFQSYLYNVLNIFSSLLIIGFGIYGLVFLKVGIKGILGGIFLGNIIVLPFRVWTVRSLLKINFSKKLLKKLLSFGVPLVPTSLAYWVFTSSDKIVLGKLSSLEQLGQYSVATTIISGFGLALNAFGQAWSPYAFKCYEESQEYAKNFYGQVLTYLLLLFGTLGIFVTTFSKEIIMIMSTPIYYPASIAIGPLAIGFVAFSTTQITAIGITITKKTQYFALFSWVAALINLGLNLIFIPKWGMIAASLTTAISYIFLTVIFGIKTQQLWPIKIEKDKVLKASLLILIFATLINFLPAMPLIWGILMKMGYCVCFFFFLFLVRILEKKDWVSMLSFLRLNFQ